MASYMDELTQQSGKQQALKVEMYQLTQIYSSNSDSACEENINCLFLYNFGCRNLIEEPIIALQNHDIIVNFNLDFR